MAPQTRALTCFPTTLPAAGAPLLECRGVEDRGGTVPGQQNYPGPPGPAVSLVRAGPLPAQPAQQPVPASWQSVEGEARERAECCENAANVTMLLWGEIL